jgi:hypothetical protein
MLGVVSRCLTIMEITKASLTAQMDRGVTHLTPPMKMKPKSRLKPKSLLKPKSRLNSQYTAHTSTGSAPVRVNETQSEIKRLCESELLNYRSTNGIPAFAGSKMNDPLLWWKQHAGTFPTLWLLASYFLAIPATSALSERCFSAAGRIFTPSRAGVMSTDSFMESYCIKRNMDLLPSTPQKMQKK